MKILILGSEGFIGKHLVHFYQSKGAQVSGADLLEVGTQDYHYFKITRLSPDFDELLIDDAFDICINAAGSGNVTYSMSHPVSDFEANCLDTIRILDGIRRHQPACRYLHISSAAVYGNPVRLPVREDDRLLPMSPYGWHKMVSENICKEYALTYHLKTAIVRPFSVYGPGLKKQLFWDLYQKITKTGAGDLVELWGTGKESRDFIYVLDLVQAFDKILVHGEMNGEQYSIASGNEVSIESLAAMFLESVGTNVQLQFNQRAREGDPQNWRADISKMTALGYKNTVNIKEGILSTVAWLKKQ